MTNRAWDAETLPEDDHLSPDGRVMAILSETNCQGWLEGYLLTVVMVSSPVMKPLFTSLIPCSTNTPNG